MSVFDQLRQLFTGRAVDLPADATYIDVRSVGEFGGGHIPNAKNIPVDQIAATIEKVVPDKNQPIVVYCASGMRSASARNILLKKGYQNVTNGGGVMAVAHALQLDLVR